MRLSQQLPALEVAKQHAAMLHNLAETLAAHNSEQYNTLLVTKDELADPTRWREVRRRDGVRVYKERVGATQQDTTTPQLLSLGTFDGTLDDGMDKIKAASKSAVRNSTPDAVPPHQRQVEAPRLKK